MANINHESFRQPENKNLRLWRYMDFTKFVFLIATKTLFFCRADLFDDPFEGSYSKANVAMRPHVYKDIPKNHLGTMLSQHSDLAKWLREWTYINCWHANEHESAAMWKLYAQTNEAVSIETDYQTLANILPSNVFLGLVNYIDYDAEWLPERNTFAPFMHKRKSFEHEREVHAVVQEPPVKDNIIPIGLKNSLSGIQVESDIHKLVKCIHISPKSPDWFYNLVAETAQKFGFTFKVQKSNLYSDPVF
jgi:hypothetical protein